MVPFDAVVQPESAAPTALPQYVKRALDYLRANMAEKVTLADLATVCGISQRALLKQFNALSRCLADCAPSSYAADGGAR